MKLNPVKLTTVVFEEGMAELAIVFQDKKISEDFLKTYYRRLNFCRDKDFLQAVDDIIDKEQWFPTVKVFLAWLPEPERWAPSIDELCS